MRIYKPKLTAAPLPLSAAAMLHPHTSTEPEMLNAITSGKPRATASRADLAPQPERPGAGNARETPSRNGNRLHYRDGRITDMQGNSIAPDTTPRPKHRNVARQIKP